MSVSPENGPARRHPAILIVRGPGLSTPIGQAFARDVYHVRTAVDGDEAVVSFVDRPPDLLLLDAGRDVLERIHFWNTLRLESAPGLGLRPLLVLGRTTEWSVHARALDGGADCFLSAPVSDALLRLRIDTLLRRNPVAGGA